MRLMRLLVVSCLLVCVCGYGLPRRNLVRNGSFEEQGERGGAQQWTFERGRADAEGGVYGKESRSGGSCFRLVNRSGYQPHVFAALTQRVEGMVAGMPHTLSFYAKSPDSGRAWFGGGGRWQYRKGFALKGGDWQRFSLTVTPEESDLPFVFRIHADSATPELLIDDVQIERGVSATAFEAARELPLGGGEMELRPWRAPANLLADGGFECLSGVRPQGWVWDVRNTDATFEVLDERLEGSRVVRITNGTPYGAHVYAWLGHLGDVPVKPLTTYTVSLRARAEGGNGSAWFGGGRDWRRRRGIPDTKGAWRRLSLTFETGAEERQFSFMVVVERPVRRLDIADIEFVEGEQPETTEALTFGQDGMSFQPQAPERVRRGGREVMPYWDEQSFPWREWLFTEGVVRLDGAVTVAASRRGAEMQVVCRDAGGVELARVRRALPEASEQAWLAELELRLKDSAAERLTLEGTVFGADGQALFSRTTELSLVMPSRARATLERLRGRVARVRAASAGLPSPSRSEVLGLLSERFLGYASQDIGEGRLNRAWYTLTQVEPLVSEAEARLAAIRAGRLSEPVIPMYRTGRTRLSGPSFLGRVQAGSEIREGWPVFFNGYGHFGQVRRDVELFPRYGLNLIQVEHGPSGTLRGETETDMTALREFRRLCERAAAANVSVNLLVSPHYFPQWALERHPELRQCGGGFFRFCVHAPEARAVLERFLRVAIPEVRDLPALHSICLTNEPISNGSATCPHVRRRWVEWLRCRHGSVEALNARWGTSHPALEAVPVPEAREGFARPQAYDFILCNQELFAEFHEWLAAVVHELAPGLPVHSKIMLNSLFGVNVGGVWSISAELFGRLSDISGNDHYSVPQGEGAKWCNMWRTYLLGYDLQRSLKDAPVFNSENHLIPDRHFRAVRPEHIHSSLFQGAVHGNTASTIWVWERTNNPIHDFAGSILHRPQEAVAVSQASMDLLRLAAEVTALQRRSASVALVWSLASQLHSQGAHVRTLTDVWQALVALDQRVGFMTERQLTAIGAGGALPATLAGVRCLLVPSVTHLPEGARRGLARLPELGVRVVVLGAGCGHDEYGNALAAPAGAGLDWPRQDDDAARLAVVSEALRRCGVTSRAQAVSPATGEPLWGVEVLSAELPDGRVVVNVCNQRREAVSARLSWLGRPLTGVELLSGASVTGELELPSLKSLVIEVAR